ncbi:MAG: hypothetical protein COB24_14120 [Hyphomicrobiales bacterium]|nr:MAG: hypothetical protein COB24_14120 [Hyphomicrobiales bacterium]
MNLNAACGQKAKSSIAIVWREIVIAKDMKDYEAFTHRFFFNASNVRRFRSSIVVAREKVTSYVPL